MKIALDWLEKNTLPKSVRFIPEIEHHLENSGETELLKPEEFSITEFAHVVKHLVSLDLVNYVGEALDGDLQITPQGQDFLRGVRENSLIFRWSRQLLDNIPTIIVSVVTALLIGWAMKLWGPVAP